MLLPSVLGFALCFVCLAATTWAWFTASVTSEANTIQTANFGVAVTVNGNPVAADANGDYTLAAGNHTVTLKKTGNAEKVYLLINNNGTEAYTSYLGSGDVEYSFTIEVADNTTATITPKWGELPGNSPIDIGSPLALLSEDPADETQQEEEQENQQQEEENPSDENNPADDSENNGEGENNPSDTPDDGEQGGEQQTDEPSTPTEGEGEQQGGDPIVEGEPSSSNVGDNTGGEPSTGGETGESNVPEDTADTADTTTPTVQSEGGVSADPAPIE